MNGSTTFRISDGVLTAPFGDTLVALDLTAQQIHHLGSVAAWLMAQDSPVSIEELLGGVPRGSDGHLLDGIRHTIAELRSIGLIDRADRYEPPPIPEVVPPPATGAHLGDAHAVVGRRVVFRSDDAGLVGLIDAHLASSVDAAATDFIDVRRERGRIVAYARGVWDFAHERQLIDQLPAMLNHFVVGDPGVVALHAGAVRTPDGRVLLLVGPSGAGKSTLTAALVAAGCDYLSDEAIGIGGDHTILGFPKPMVLGQPAREALGLSPVDAASTTPAELRADVEQLAVGTVPESVLLVRFDPDVVGAQLGEPLPPMEALEALLSNTLHLGRLDQAAFEAVCGLVESVPIVPLTHGGLELAVAAVLGNR